jgi:putative membrane protein
MADSTTTAGPDRFEVRVTADSHMAWIRTRLSIERTLMAWVRTAVALIGFGFAIVRFFVFWQQLSGSSTTYGLHASEYLGLGLITCGILALLISIWQYRWAVRYLGGGSFAPIAGMKEGGMHSAVLAVAILLVGIGLFAFLAVLLRLV